MEKSNFVLFAGLSGAMAIAAGAFAAHGLDAEIYAPRVSWLKTGAEYQLIHAVALLALAVMGNQRFASQCFVAGIVLFSGSLYLLAATGVLWLGAITPLGGLAFIIGWLAIAWWAWKKS